MEGKKRLHAGGSLAMKPLLSGIKKYCETWTVLLSTRRVLLYIPILCFDAVFQLYKLCRIMNLLRSQVCRGA